MASPTSPSRLRLTALALGLAMAGAADLPALAQYDPLSGLPPPAPARAAPQAVAQQGAYDPYGPKSTSAPVKRNTSYGATRLLEVIDGTPRYEIMPERSVSLSQTARSGLVSMNLHDGLPVDAGPYGSPKRTGTTEDLPVLFHYLVKFWETYPQAKVVTEGKYTRLPGEVTRTPVATNRAAPTPPPAIKARLDQQAKAMLDAIHAYPWIQRSQGVVTRTYLDYHLDKDPSGRAVWGFKARVALGYLGSGTTPVQKADGRWTATCYDWQSIEICSNCFSRVSKVWGRYRGFQTMDGDILIDTLNTPLFVSEFRTGEGKQIPNPEFYDLSRPQGDIQILTVKSPANDVGGLARTVPDSYSARPIAAAYLTDWKRLVDQGNGPGAPRAD